MGALYFYREQRCTVEMPFLRWFMMGQTRSFAEVNMTAGTVQETGASTAARYEALIRISNSIRARKQPQELFDILVDELGKAIPFDAIAQFDESSNKLRWHMGPACRCREYTPAVEKDGETLAHFVYRTQEAVILGTPESSTRFPDFTKKMREAGLES